MIESRSTAPTDTSPAPFQSDLARDLDAAILRAQENLLGLQHADGYWIGELMVDCTLVADMVAYHHWNGKVDRKWQRKAVNHLFSLQLPDGGWNIYPGGPAEVNATIKAYLALKLAGVPVTDPRMLRARADGPEPGRRAAHEHLLQALPGPDGPVSLGIRAHHSRAKSSSSANGSTCNFNDMSSWSRAMLVPLSIINHFKPTRPLPNVPPWRTYPAGFSRARLLLAPRPAALHLAQFLPLAGPAPQVRRTFRRPQHPSLPQARLEKGRGMDGGTL